jgi:hypothetical protein
VDFSRHYYAAETGNPLDEMLDREPLRELPWPGVGDTILRALEPVTASFLDRMAGQVDWSRYDVIGFSLTISQLGASIAFARRLKLKHPGLFIVFGGSQCAGVMGRAILRACAYVDCAVHIEGESVFRKRAVFPSGISTGLSLTMWSWNRQRVGNVAFADFGRLQRSGRL